ncbi:hypothetical protein Tco_0865611, partial [Tanacetum coccineum]
VMAAPVISISLYSSNESVGSSISRVILFGSIPIEVHVVPADLPITPEVGAADVALPVGMEEQIASQPSSSPSAVIITTTYTSGFDRKEDGWTDFSSLALRYTSHYLDRFTSGSSSDHSSLDRSPVYHFSFGHSTLDQTLYGHTSPVTLHLLIHLHLSLVYYPPPARTSRGTEAFCRWRAAQLSTMYPLTTSESSAGDSSSESSAGPSRKKCRFRDSYSSEDSIEEDIDADVLADIEADAGVDDGISMEVSVEVVSEDDEEYEAESSTRGTVEIGMNRVIEPVVAEDIAEPTSENYHDLASVDGSREVMQMGLDVAMQELYNHMHEILVDRIMEIEAGHRQLEVESLIASGERAGLLDRVVSLERSNTRLRDTLRMESVRVDGFRRRMGYMEDEFRQIRMFRYNDRLRFRRFEAFTTRRLVFVPRVILSRAVYGLYTSGRASY